MKISNKTIKFELFVALIECSELAQLTSLACLILIDGWYLQSTIYGIRIYLRKSISSRLQELSFHRFTVFGFDPLFTSDYNVYTVYMSWATSIRLGGSEKVGIHISWLGASSIDTAVKIILYQRDF